jgi:hypothetical protein
MLSPRSENQPEALGREKLRQRVTKPSGHPDKNGSRRILTQVCSGVTANYRGLSAQMRHLVFLLILLVTFKVSILGKKKLTAHGSEFGNHIRQSGLA